jgi:hypothetical protein
MERPLLGTAIVGFKNAISGFASSREKRTGAWLFGAGLALVLFKLWLVSAETIFAIGYANYDDALYLKLAASLVRGEWLGPYDKVTLAHGPMYPLFIAGAYRLGLPLFMAQQFLYVLACVLMVLALRPLMKNVGLRFGLFSVLLFNPVTYDCYIYARVLRQDILHSLVLMILASGVALYARHRDPKRRLLPWALVGGISLPAFWLTREEGIWILPCVGLFWTAACVAIWRDRAPDRKMRFALLLLPPLLWAAGVGAVAAINLRYYGVFTTCELKQADFNAAYGALTRITPAQWRPSVPVSRETRERLYAVSPAFAELRSSLDGPSGENWAGISEMLTHLPREQREIGGGWFMWAFREAVEAAGHCHSGAEAKAYYARLAYEVNDLCDRGVVRAGPRRTGFLPPLRQEYIHPFLSSARSAAWMLMSFDQMSTRTAGSIGNAEDLALYLRLTRGRLSPLRDGSSPPERPLRLEGMRLAILDGIRRAYSTVAPWAGGAAAGALLAAIGAAIVRRRLPYFAFVGCALLSSMLALMTIMALVNSTSFPALDTGYLAGGYVMWLLLMFVGWLPMTEGSLSGTAKTHIMAPPPSGC